MSVNVQSKITKNYRFKMNGDYMYVYEGMCDNKPTKWLTYDKWDYTMRYKTIKGELEITDTNNREILVFDTDDSEYYDIKPLNKRGEYKLLISEKKKDIADHYNIISEFFKRVQKLIQSEPIDWENLKERDYLNFTLMSDFGILETQQKKKIAKLKAEIKELKRKMPPRKKGLFKRV